MIQIITKILFIIQRNNKIKKAFEIIPATIVINFIISILFNNRNYLKKLHNAYQIFILIKPRKKNH